MAEKYSMVCINHNLFIHSSIDGHLGCFHIFAIVNNSAMNMGIYIYIWVRIFIFFRYIPKSRISESYGGSIFNFFRTLPTIFMKATPIYIPTVNYKLALTESIANNWTTKAFATASMEIEPHAALDVDLQQSLRELRVAWGTLCSRESLGSWMFLETDFMISILASPHI